MATDDRYRYQEIIVDSGDFNTGTKNKPEFQFDQIIDDSTYFQVHRAVVPTTYYVFDSNRTSITMTTNPGAVTATYTWPVGNYTPSEWIAIMTAQLPATIVVTYDATTNKLKFKDTGGNAFTITFSATQLANTELGFDTGSISSSVISGETVIFSPNVVNFSGPNFMYLRASMASVFNNSEIFFSNSSRTSTGGDILAMIPIDQNRNSVVNYIDNTGHFFQWKSVGSKRLLFYFTLGRRTDAVDFNGQTFQLRIHGYSLSEGGLYRFNS
jgi:hypothetical protein